MRAGRIALIAFAVLGAVAVGTYVAGEQGEIVVLRTRGGDGALRETKLWVVDHDGAPWVRVARPGRRWFQRLSRDPRAVLVRNGVAQPVVARAEDAADVRAAIDERFREKYGAVDWWYGVLLRRNPVPVRLDAATGQALHIPGHDEQSTD